LAYLAEGLRDRGHVIGLWASGDHAMDGLCERLKGCAEIFRAPYRNTYQRALRSLSHCFDRSGDAALAESFAAFRPDVIHLNKQNLEDGLDLLRACSTVPATCMVHITQPASYLQARGAWLRDAIARRALTAFPGTFLTTPSKRCEELKEFLRGEGRVASCQNGVPDRAADFVSATRKETRLRCGISDDAPLVIAVGRLEAQKLPLRFVDWCSQFAAQNREARFLWVGSGSLEEATREAAREAGLEDRFQITGWVTDVAPYLQAADVYFHSADFEGMPFALLEACSAGLPCVLDPRLAAELGLDDKAGILQSSESGLWSRLGDEQARREAGRKARRLYESEFTLAGMAESFELAFLETLAATRR